MGVCEHCKYRYSWDCDDGLAYPKGGCSDFVLDYSTTTDEQRKRIKELMYMEEIEND